MIFERFTTSKRYILLVLILIFELCQAKKGWRLHLWSMLLNRIIIIRHVCKIILVLNVNLWRLLLNFSLVSDLGIHHHLLFGFFILNFLELSIFFHYIKQFFLPDLLCANVLFFILQPKLKYFIVKFCVFNSGVYLLQISDASIFN